MLNILNQIKKDAEMAKQLEETYTKKYEAMVKKSAEKRKAKPDQVNRLKA